MIAFGCATTSGQDYLAYAAPGIERVAEEGSLVMRRHGRSSIQEPYNEMMDEAAARDDLEALVLLHQDIELLDDSLLARVRPLLADPRNAVISPLGWRDVGLHRWSNSGNQYGRSRTPEMDVHHSAGSYEVDVADGVLFVLAPWVVRTVRFSGALAADFHGYDVDFCRRVRARGGRIVCNDIPYVHHMVRPWTDRAQFVRASRALAERWDPALRPPEWAPALAP
jgi:GT2 family glycosyltransferase